MNHFIDFSQTTTLVKHGDPSSKATRTAEFVIWKTWSNSTDEMQRRSCHHVRAHLTRSICFSKMLTSIICLTKIGYPGQQLLEEAIDENKRISATKYEEGVRIVRDAARTQGIEKTLAEYNLDVILGPMDGRIPTIAAAAGYPVGTMPLGYSKTNGRPFGMCIVAAANNEDKILRAMRAWDATIAERKVPPQLQSKQTVGEDDVLRASFKYNHQRSESQVPSSCKQDAMELDIEKENRFEAITVYSKQGSVFGTISWFLSRLIIMIFS